MDPGLLFHFPGRLCGIEHFTTAENTAHTVIGRRSPNWARQFTHTIHSAFSQILISPDIWIHFWIQIGIPDHFAFVLQTTCWNRWRRAGLCPPRGQFNLCWIRYHRSLLLSFTPGSKPTFPTNPSHLRFILPTGLPHDNGTGLDLLRSSFYF